MQIRGLRCSGAAQKHLLVLLKLSILGSERVD